MTQEETMDSILYALYEHSGRGKMFAIRQLLVSNNQEISTEEIRNIVYRLDGRGFIVKQPQHSDFNVQITDMGIAFCNSNSFSVPGTSIIVLMENKVLIEDQDEDDGDIIDGQGDDLADNIGGDDEI